MKAMILVCSLVFSTAASAQVPAGLYVAITSGREVNAAIEQATADFNFIKRPIARQRLREANPILRTIAIRPIGDSVEVTLNDQWVLRSKPGSTREWSGYKNERLQVSTAFDGGVLTNVFISKNGQEENRYLFNGDELELEVRITSPLLKHVIDYVQRFRRVN